MILSSPNALKKKAEPGNTPLITLDHITFTYSPSQPLLHDFSWQLEDGESWAILGPTGCGKTTLLYLLTGLRKPASGQIRLNGGSVNRSDHNVGLMLQDYGLLPWYTARQNVELGMKIRSVPRAERESSAIRWMERLEIAHVAGQYPSQLSGGQRQRVALARLLALDTRVLLLDEPFSAVDEITRERLQKLLWDIQRDVHTTTVLVTHSVEEAVLLADKLMIITDYSPIEMVTILDSPFDGEMPRRSDPQFSDFCTEIRSLLNI
jgi:NitT/TauT family transport system ATP-binding protein